MKSKYQIFVSSTYEDLKDERDEVIKAILEMGHIPVGMEMFSAGDDQQWELIKRHIDDSDYYLVIVAHRYGSLDGTTSYTEKEYDYAVSQGIPALGFLLSDDAKWPRTRIDDDQTRKAALISFKDKVKRKIVSFWKTEEDLHAKVSIALGKAFTAYPRPGWIRSQGEAGPDVTAELSRLSRENAALRATINSASQQKKLDEKDELQKSMALLKKNKVEVSLYFDGESDWSEGPTVTLLKIFEILAPELLVEKSVAGSAEFLAFLLKSEAQSTKKLRKNWPMPSNLIKELLADFHALGLLEPSLRKHHLKDENHYWTLTGKGKALYFLTRISSLEANVSKEVSDAETKKP